MEECPQTPSPSVAALCMARHLHCHTGPLPHHVPCAKPLTSRATVCFLVGPCSTCRPTNMFPPPLLVPNPSALLCPWPRTPHSESTPVPCCLAPGVTRGRMHVEQHVAHEFEVVLMFRTAVLMGALQRMGLVRKVLDGCELERDMGSQTHRTVCHADSQLKGGECNPCHF